MRTVIFVPVFNQKYQLPDVLREIEEAALADVDFLLINNGSSDGSEDLVHESGHPYLDVPRNCGVGYSNLISVDWGLEHGYDVFGCMASNGKMLPTEIPNLLAPIREDRADYVTASRFMKGGDSPNLPGFRRGAIPLVNRWVWLTTGAHLTDATCGFRAFRLDMMPRARFDWHAEWLYTYAFEYYLYAKVLLDDRLRAIEVPGTMRYPKEGSYSKIRPGRDWLAMLKPWLTARLDRKGFE